ncbi:MAG: putative dedicator of cytokinesis protein 11 [Streblomastix strix]|uniref:Putative dedicator of cytokinesis protein 11 n=1 Tax=Streblomastix strix TaxID=222440 RepID=A0A5J4WMY4_9EUKA|nr:MAG: putative dedicator of cytokinesis protein 11 [Streblomastix strix]
MKTRTDTHFRNSAKAKLIAAIEEHHDIDIQNEKESVAKRLQKKEEHKRRKIEKQQQKEIKRENEEDEDDDDERFYLFRGEAGRIKLDRINHEQESATYEKPKDLKSQNIIFGNLIYGDGSLLQEISQAIEEAYKKEENKNKKQKKKEEEYDDENSNSDEDDEDYNIRDDEDEEEEDLEEVQNDDEEDGDYETESSQSSGSNSKDNKQNWKEKGDKAILDNQSSIIIKNQYFPKEFYEMLKAFVMFSSIVATLSPVISARYIVSELATFITHLWTIADRRKVNKLIQMFVQTFYPDEQRQTLTQRRIIVEMLIVFWRTLTSADCWIQVSIDSGLIQQRRKNQFSGFFLTNIMIHSLFKCHKIMKGIGNELQRTKSKGNFASAIYFNNFNQNQTSGQNLGIQSSSQQQDNINLTGALSQTSTANQFFQQKGDTFNLQDGNIFTNQSLNNQSGGFGTTKSFSSITAPISIKRFQIQDQFISERSSSLSSNSGTDKDRGSIGSATTSLLLRSSLGNKAQRNVIQSIPSSQSKTQSGGRRDGIFENELQNGDLGSYSGVQMIGNTQNIGEVKENLGLSNVQQSLTNSTSSLASLITPATQLNPRDVEAEDEYQLMDADGFRNERDNPASIRPFFLFREMLTRFDLDERMNNIRVRMAVSELHFAFLRLCVSNFDLLSNQLNLNRNEMYDCQLSCMWLLLNANLNVVRQFITQLKPKFYPSIFHLLLSTIDNFEPQTLSLFIMQQRLNQGEFEKQLQQKEIQEAGIAFQYSFANKQNFRRNQMSVQKYTPRSQISQNTPLQGIAPFNITSTNSKDFGVIWSPSVDKNQPYPLIRNINSPSTTGTGIGSLKKQDLFFGFDNKLQIVQTQQQSGQGNMNEEGKIGPISSNFQIHNENSYPSTEDENAAQTINHILARLISDIIIEYIACKSYNSLIKEKKLTRIKPPVFLGQHSAMEIILEKVTTDKNSAGRVPWVFSAATAERMQENFKNFTGQEENERTMRGPWDTTLALLKRDLSDEATIDVLGMAFYLLRITAHMIIMGNRQYLTRFIKYIMRKTRSSNTAIRLRTVALLYWLLKIEYLLTNHVHRVGSVCMLIVSRGISGGKTSKQYNELINNEENIDQDDNSDSLMKRGLTFNKPTKEKERDEEKRDKEYKFEQEKKTEKNRESKEKQSKNKQLLHLEEKLLKEENNVKLSLQMISEFANKDTDKKLKIDGLIKVSDQLQLLYEDTKSVAKLKDTDGDLKAELAYAASSNYKQQPELRIEKISVLMGILGEKEGINQEEIAMTQTIKCIIILDILSAIMRHATFTLVNNTVDADNKEGEGENINIEAKQLKLFQSVFQGVQYPQYLPIRSDYARVWRDGGLYCARQPMNEAIHSMSQTASVAVVGGQLNTELALDAIFNKQEVKMAGKQRYGGSWCSWDVILRNIIPQIKNFVYKHDELEKFMQQDEFSESIHSSSIFTIQNATKQLELALHYMEEAKIYEFSLHISRVLEAFYMALNWLEQLQQLYLMRSTAYSAILATDSVITRIQSTYYFIQLMGPMFGKENNAQYIIKEYNFKGLGDVKVKLLEKYKKRFGIEPVILQSTNFENKQEFEDIISQQGKDKPYIQLISVKPYLTDRERGERKSQFEQLVNISTFSYDRVFNSKDPKQKNIPLQDQSKRLIVFETEHPFPFCTRRVQVNAEKTKIIKYSPCALANIDLHSRIKNIEDKIDPLDENSLLRLLQGAVAPQVNVGPIGIFRCFLRDYRDTCLKEELEELRRTFNEFFQTCQRAFIVLHSENVSIELLGALEESMIKMIDEVRFELSEFPFFKEINEAYDDI